MTRQFTRHKYKAKRSERAGYSFASKLEASVFDHLMLLQKAGEIKDLKCQDTVYLTDARIIYKPDFRFVDVKTGETIWAEAKGVELGPWRQKLKLWRFYGPGPLHIYKGHHLRPTLVEVVIPKGVG